MKVINFFSIAFFLKFILLIIPVSIISGNSATAQRAEQPDGSIPLLSNECVTSIEDIEDPSYYLIENDRKQISLDKQIFFTEFYIASLDDSPISNGFNNIVLLTCKLDKAKNLETLKIQFGIEDFASDEKHEVQVRFYIDSNQVSSYKIHAGKGVKTVLDIANVSDIAIEVECIDIDITSSGTCPEVNFIEAKLFPR